MKHVTKGEWFLIPLNCDPHSHSIKDIKSRLAFVEYKNISNEFIKSILYFYKLPTKNDKIIVCGLTINLTNTSHIIDIDSQNQESDIKQYILNNLSELVLLLIHNIPKTHEEHKSILHPYQHKIDEIVSENDKITPHNIHQLIIFLNSIWNKPGARAIDIEITNGTYDYNDIWYYHNYSDQRSYDCKAPMPMKSLILPCLSESKV